MCLFSAPEGREEGGGGGSLLQGEASCAPPEGPQGARQNLLAPDPQGSPSPRSPAPHVYTGRRWELGGGLERTPHRAVLASLRVLPREPEWLWRR